MLYAPISKTVYLIRVLTEGEWEFHHGKLFVCTQTTSCPYAIQRYLLFIRRCRIDVTIGVPCLRVYHSAFLHITRSVMKRRE